MLKSLLPYISSILDALLPRRCVGCSTYDTWICTPCIQSALHITHISTNPEWRRYSGIEKITTLGPYGNPLWRTAIQKLKFTKIHSIADSVGKELAACIGHDFSYSKDSLVIIPVPMHPKRKKERGFNQSQLISAAIQKNLGGIVIESAAIRISHSQSQTTFSHTERQSRMQGLFAASHEASRVTGKIVLLVDDVITTGATAAEVGHVLLGYAPQSIHLIAVAHGS